MSITKNTLLALFDLFKTTYQEWKDDGASRLAAALAYYTAFSIAPLLTLVIAVIGIAVTQDTIRQNIITEVQTNIGPDTAELVADILDNTSQPTEGIISTALGIGALILGAIGVFGHLQTSLDIIWNVESKTEGSGIWRMLRDRLLSFGMLWVLGFLLLISLVVSTLLSALDTHLLSHLPASRFILQLLSFVVSYVVITMLFAFIYKFLPHIKIAWKDVWIGASFTALLFTIGKTLLGFYLGRGSTASTYGAAGAFVLILLWVYYSAQIVLFGAEFTQVFARRYGSLRPRNAPTLAEEATQTSPQTTVQTAPSSVQEDGFDTKKKSLVVGAFTGIVLAIGALTSWWQSRNDAASANNDPT